VEDTKDRSMNHFAIAGIQMSIGMGKNTDAIRMRIDLLMHLYPWVQMVVLSELAAHGPNPASTQETGGPLEQEFCDIARKHSLWLVAGSLFESRNGRIYNTTPVIDPQGNVVQRYRKMFPFAPYEDASSPGDEFCIFDVPDVGRFGVAICYDLWFPEVTRTLTSMGAEVIINPVLAHFVDRPADLAVAQASAAMFQCYIFHINGVLAGGNGQSLVVDPSGRILHQGSVGEEFIPMEVDFGLVRRQRERGLLTMGQPLKSFRDSTVRFGVYDRANFDDSYLQGLGPLVKPGRATA
jgi:predicted amidohydrolase